MNIYTPPKVSPADSTNWKVFLAGSIEMGKASEWQIEFAKRLDKKWSAGGYAWKVDIFNPRRKDWNSNWKQDISDPNFCGQVNWELDHLDIADAIAMYLEPGTMSPITLMEFGLYASTGKLIVFCPDGFYRKGNVDIVSKRRGVQQVSSMEELLDKTVEMLLS